MTRDTVVRVSGTWAHEDCDPSPGSGRQAIQIRQTPLRPSEICIFCGNGFPLRCFTLDALAEDAIYLSRQAGEFHDMATNWHRQGMTEAVGGARRARNLIEQRMDRIALYAVKTYGQEKWLGALYVVTQKLERI